MARTGKTALVTGASAGLGAELSRLFAADGHDVVLVARRLDRLSELATQLEREHGVRARPLAEDLTDAAAPARIANAVREGGTEIEFLVNNAGFGTTGAFARSDAKRELEMIQVNVVALVHLTRLFLPDMVTRRRGRILNVGSTAGFQPGPFMAAYYASKAFVNSFTEALWFELKGTGVTATVSCPGATATEFGQVAGNGESKLFKLGAMNPGQVAAHAYHAMMRGKRMAVPGLKNKFGVQSLRVSPRGAVLSITAALNDSGRVPALPVARS